MKTFILYDLICAENFVQDKVVGIDVQSQEVILKNSSVNVLLVVLTIYCLVMLDILLFVGL